MAESETLSLADTSTENQEDPLQDLSDEQLYQLLDDTIRANEVLATETQMFDKYLKRVDKDMTFHQAPTTLMATPSQSTHDLGGRVSRKRSKSRSSTMDRTLRLSAEQKCDIALREIEEYREELEKLHEESERIMDNFKAIMEECDLRLAEMKKASYEFERDVVKGSINPRTNKVIAEKVVRYLEDKLRARGTLIEKLRLKNATLKVQKKKLHMQLKQKEEMGEVLHEVDFNQLKIENQQYIEKIDERNQDLLRLKLMAGNTLQVLNSYKKKLHYFTLQSEQLKSEITSRNDLLSRIDSETHTVEEERAAAEKINRKLRQHLADYRVPDVMVYVKEKADLYELKKKVRTWERKVEIAEMALDTHRKAWKQIQMAAQQVNPWGTMQAV
ncbi:hypothetical protein LSH36_1095g00096 [Paralvinella palmiformis]|uniref:Cilia- and flagella-associated protein 263 n=1 Tax=Paralvinella palmiformis TaxID=53620 RepID=A0AAD9IVN0_9ANNE|nr:hypothetical protein LSH36_1095g00096 [Paralvinella palmiformis]